MFTNLSYRAVEDVLFGFDSLMSAAEAHGTLTGMLCAGTLTDCDAGVAEVLGGVDEINDSARESRCVLVALCGATRRVLEEENCAFDLFLPGDDVPLSERAQGLSEWCRGFLYGLGCGGNNKDWPKTCHEVVRDFIEIARLDPHAEGETDEVAYMELAEYVRVGTQLLHGEWQQSVEKESVH